MDKLRIYVCGHNARLNRVPSRSFITKVNLNDLEIGKYQDNQLSENRIYFSDLIKEPVEYIGFISQRYREKWPSLVPFQGLNQLPLSPNILYCAHIPFPRWGEWFRTHFPGIEPLFDDMLAFSGFSEQNWPSLFANNFICHWDVFQKFMEYWRPIFDYLYEKYPPESMTFHTEENNRRAGYLYEALSVLVFAHLIKELNLDLRKMEIPQTVFRKRILV